MHVKFIALKTNVVDYYRLGGLDANLQKPQILISDGTGNPCRHCLTEIAKGKSMLVLSHRPFENINPYAEIGPVFLCADACSRHPDSNDLPLMFTTWEQTLIRGYNTEGRIVYGSGSVIPMSDVKQHAVTLFEDDKIVFLHMRSASYNCYQCRIERDSA